MAITRPTPAAIRGLVTSLFDRHAGGPCDPMGPESRFRGITATTLHADARRAASIIMSSSMRLSGRKVDWMMMQPRIDSLCRWLEFAVAESQHLDLTEEDAQTLRRSFGEYSEPRPEKILILWIAIGYGILTLQR